MKYEAVTYTHSMPCPHENGWIVNIGFFFNLFHLRRFVCSDCGETLKIKVVLP